METNKKILLVEDDQNFGVILRDYLSLNDFDVTLAKNGMEGFEKFKKDNFDLCILM
jgi:two-component system OmpR family response regulator